MHPTYRGVEVKKKKKKKRKSYRDPKRNHVLVNPVKFYNVFY